MSLIWAFSISLDNTFLSLLKILITFMKQEFAFCFRLGLLQKIGFPGKKMPRLLPVEHHGG
jgi:hypothetical protein